jgi:hypothetical protein
MMYEINKVARRKHKPSVDFKQYFVFDIATVLAVWKYVKDGHKEKGWALTQDSLDRRRYSTYNVHRPSWSVRARDLDVIETSSSDVIRLTYRCRTS